MGKKSGFRQLMAGVNGGTSSGRVIEDYHSSGAIQTSEVVRGTMGRRILSAHFISQARRSAQSTNRRGLTGVCPPEFAVRYTGTLPSVNGMLDKVFNLSPDSEDFGTVKAFGLVGTVGYWRNSHRRVIGVYLTSAVVVGDLDHATQIPGDFDRLRDEQNVVEDIADPGAESNGRGYLQAALFSLPLRTRVGDLDAIAESLEGSFAQMPIKLGVLSELPDQRLLDRH